MSIPAPVQPVRNSKRTTTNPITAGLPDPRVLTGYDTEYAEQDDRSVLYVYLNAPCVIRNPVWAFVNGKTGFVVEWGGKPLDAGTPDESNTTLVFWFDDIIDPAINVVFAPYQDPAVQNFHGGFVTPMAKWFREVA